MSYVIEDKIGEGGMGCVYKAHDSYGNLVALKMMSNKVAGNQEYKELFNAEVNVLRKMHHPRIVGIVGDPYSDSEGNLYLPMEYVEGETLKQVVSRKGPFSEADAIELMLKIFDGMSHVHNSGNIHRDIKPSNIMLKPDNDVKIIDFGIAKDAKVGSSGHTVGRIVGTDGYMSPEQANGLNIDLRTDVYSLGCLLFFLVTGQNAINKGSNEYETVCAILDKPFPSVRQINPSLSAEIDDIIHKATDKNMLTRYQNVGQFSAALSSIGMSSGNGGTATRVAPGFSSITVGKSPDNTIVMNNQYVSRHHLDISCIKTGDVLNITITDHSTNGTGIGGKYLKNSSSTMVYDGFAPLPDLMLAGRSECILSWDTILNALNVMLSQEGVSERFEADDINHVSESKVVENKVEQPVDPEDKLNAILCILSFLCPIVGWIIWGIRKKDKPKSATLAAQLAWIGFSIGVVLNLIQSI